MRQLTLKSIAVLVSFLYCVLTQETDDPTPDAKLILVVETFRHGVRNRIYNGSYPDSTPQSEYGELTLSGERMHYILGQTLREKYSNTAIQFPEEYNNTFIWVKSTNRNRTIMSAYSQLQGMFKWSNNTNNQLAKINQELIIPPFSNLSKQNMIDQSMMQQNTKAVAVHMLEMKNEKQLLGYNPIVCKQQIIWKQENRNSVEVKRIRDAFQAPVIDKLASIERKETVIIEDNNNNIITPNQSLPFFGITESSKLHEISQLVDTLISAKYRGDEDEIKGLSEILEGFELTDSEMILPENKNKLWVQMNLLFTIQQQLEHYKTIQQKRTTMTPFFNELLAYFNNALNNQQYFKWIMLSAHDTTLGMISQAMNFTSWECIEKYHLNTLESQSPCIYSYPGFASSIIFELYKDIHQKPFIKVLYNGTEMAICSTNKTYCYLDRFSEIINAFFVEDFDVACKNNEEIGQVQQTKDELLNTWQIVVLTVIMTLLCEFLLRKILKLIVSQVKQVGQPKRTSIREL